MACEVQHIHETGICRHNLGSHVVRGGRGKKQNTNNQDRSGSSKHCLLLNDIETLGWKGDPDLRSEGSGDLKGFALTAKKKGSF